jgi:hypothetical protein
LTDKKFTIELKGVVIFELKRVLIFEQKVVLVLEQIVILVLEQKVYFCRKLLKFAEISSSRKS